MAGVWLVVAPGAPRERAVPVSDRVHIGRECAGIDPSRRIIVDDPAVSRDHAEVRFESGAAMLVDHSTNGTRVNGRRVERGERALLRDGDVITVGDLVIAVRAATSAIEIDESRRTVMSESVEPRVLLVGDVVGYTRLIEVNGSAAVAAVVDGMFLEVRRLVLAHDGTVSSFAGDAVLATWEQSANPRAAQSAVACVVALHRYVVAAAGLAPIGYEDGTPIRFGWAITAGDVATSHPSPTGITVHGDAVNLAFRLAGLASRDGHAPVLCESGVAALAPEIARYDAERSVHVKGRLAPALVRSIRL